MDERRKKIDDLTRNNQESRVSLDTLLENFGEKLYVRTKDMQVGFEDITQYNALLQDIADANASIGKIEEKNRRFIELEEVIQTKEQEEKERAKELAGVYRRLGKALLADNAYDDYTSLFREQADSLAAKLESLETRIGGLDNKEGANVFSWIGKSAQGLVLRSFLSKAQESQEQLYLDIGERYGSREPVSQDDEVSAILAEIEKLREVSHSVQDEIAVLKDEKRVISAGFGIDGNPQKQIQGVKNHIAKINEKLRVLYGNFGVQASGIMDGEISPDRKYFIDTIVAAEDGEIIGRAVRLNQSIADNEKAIGKLKASLSIDEENAKIEKLKKSIEDKKNRIADLKEDIASLEENVRDCETSIQELQKQL